MSDKTQIEYDVYVDKSFCWYTGITYTHHSTHRSLDEAKFMANHLRLIKKRHVQIYKSTSELIEE